MLFKRKAPAPRMQVVDFGPDDVLIVECPQDISQATAARIKEQTEAIVGDGQVVILAGGLEAKVIKKRPAETSV